MTGRTIVDTAALHRLLLAVQAHAQRSRVPDPDLYAAVAGVLTGSAPAPAPRTHLSIGETADALGVSERTIRRRLADGELDHRRLGRRVLIPVSAVRNGHTPPAADSRRPSDGDPERR